MEYMGEPQAGAQGMILCCECGQQIEPNAANMCVTCLRTRVDITEGIPKQGVLHFCKMCERYQQPPSAWLKAELESRELLSLCLKKIRGVGQVRLVDAGFLWTEPHSKRIKVKLTIEKEVMHGAVLQQTFVVEFVVHYSMCDDCHRVEAKDFWRACVQVRQKTSHKKTMFYLEQLIIKHKAHVNTTSIKQLNDGIDFFYALKQDARKLVDFLQACVPCRYQTAQELVSHDIHSNTYNYKNTFSVEIVPVCKDNIVCLSRKLAQQLGNMGQLCVVYRVAQCVHLIDPNTLQIAEVTGSAYWRSPFAAICHPRQLVEYMVMEIDIILEKDKRHIAGKGHDSNKHVLADVWVMKVNEVGSSEQQYHCRTHLGHLLTCGDTVFGFDVRTANINDTNFNQLKAEYMPDVVLVKKSYGDTARRMRKRKWKLHHLGGINAAETGSQDRDYNDFLEDLEEDQAYRQHINIYKDADKYAVSSDEDDDIPKISLAEMLDDLHITQDATGEDGSEMIE